MKFIYYFTTIQLLFYYACATDKYKIEGSPPHALEIETENSKLLDLIKDIAQTTKANTENVKVTISDRLNIVDSTRPPPNRPFFAGATGGNSRPQLIPPGTPWPQMIGQSSYPQFADRFTDINTITPSSNGASTTKKPNPVSTKPQVVSPHKKPGVPPRPSFAGQTGGNFRPQLVPTGTPWPSQPESTSKPQLVDRFEETPTRRPSPGFIWHTNNAFSSTFPPLVRPPISFSVDEFFPTINTNRPKPVIEIVDRIKETTAPPCYTEITKIPTRPPPNRPFYAGETGGNYKPQLIPPGKPWPARPEDYTTTGITTKVSPRNTKRPTAPQSGVKPQSTLALPTQSIDLPVEPSMLDLEFIDSSKETSTLANVPSTLSSKGSSGMSQKESTASIGNTMTETVTPKTTPKEKPVVPTRPQPNRPPFAGTTGGNSKPQIIPQGTPWPAKPEDKTSKAPTAMTTPLSLLIITTEDENSDKTTGAPFTSKPISKRKP